METARLYMILLGAAPPDRHTEQHDVFFGIGPDLRSLVPQLRNAWPAAGAKLHIDAWREVTHVNGFDVLVHPIVEFSNQAGQSANTTIPIPDPNVDSTPIHPKITVTESDSSSNQLDPLSLNPTPSHRLFFINLGGYKKGEFEEFHYKMVVAASDKGQAIQLSKNTAFYKHTGFNGASSHVDDKYGIDVDDLFEIQDILHPDTRKSYQIELLSNANGIEDEINLGYFQLHKL